MAVHEFTYPTPTLHCKFNVENDCSKRLILYALPSISPNVSPWCHICCADIILCIKITTLFNYERFCYSIIIYQPLDDGIDFFEKGYCIDWFLDNKTDRSRAFPSPNRE